MSIPEALLSNAPWRPDVLRTGRGWADRPVWSPFARDVAAAVTTGANDVLAPIRDRMPVVLERAGDD